MKLCASCQKYWPYLIPFVIASFIALLTWLTLGSEGLETNVKILWCAGIFVAVAGGLMSYMVACMRRHCGHGHGHA